MPSYDYECKECKSVIEFAHSIKEDAWVEFDCPICESKQECKRLMSFNYCNTVFKGNGWTIKTTGFGARGYKGKHQDKLRPTGTTVDAPGHKVEASKQFQRYIDSGGLVGIKPTFNMNDKADPRRPKSAEEMTGR